MKKYIFITLLLVFNTVFSQNTENVVGTISGRVDVTPTGGASYTIPIEVPPGTKGLQPNISLVYNSQSGVGIAGKGWNISGLSSIRRKGKSIFHNNKVEGIKFDDTDNFIYDGNVLVPFAGENGQENTEYRTEIESYIKCYSLGRIGNSPAYFTVETKDGSKIYYGTDNSTGNIASRTEGLYWNISKIIDEYGNYMTFSYDNNSSTTGDFLISEINYTGNISLGQAPYNKVVFEYEDYTGFTAYYFDGVKYQNTKRLKYIKTYAEGQLVKTYDIIYSNNTSNTQFSISEIKEINYLGEELNSTKFSWDLSDNSEITFQSSSYIEGLNYSMYYPGDDSSPDANRNNWFRIGDIDGDGDNDIILVGRTSLNNNFSVYVYKNDGEGAFSPAENIYPYTSGLSGNLKEILVMDWDKDGKADILSVHNNGIQLLTYNSYSNLLEFNKVLTTENITFLNEGLGEKPSFAGIIGSSFADINGDGVLDLIRVEDEGITFKMGSREDGTIEYTGTPMSFRESFDSEKHRVLFGDVNGDGMSDMVVFHTNYVYVYLANGNGFDYGTAWTTGFTYNNGWRKVHSIKLVDINGDGLCDITGLGNSACLTYLSNGKNAFESTNTYNISVSGWMQPQYPWHYIDLNNDGLIDILAFGDQSVIAYLNTGSQFVRKYTSTYLSGPESKKWPRLLVDLNGDFIPDILKIAYNGNSIMTFGEKNDNLVINSISDGFNNSTNINYDILKTPYNGQVLPYPFATISGIQLVKNLKSYSQNKLVSNIDYSFNNPVFHFAGKGFLGFLESQVNDIINQTISTNSFELNLQIASLMPTIKTTKYSFSNKRITSGTTFNVVQLGSVLPYKLFVVKKIKEDIIDEFKHNKISNEWFYDVYGNITKSVNKTISFGQGAPNQYIQTTRTFGYVNLGNGWNFKPIYDSLIITNEVNDINKQITYYEYQNNKLYRQKNHFSNDTLKNEIYFQSYNAYGFPQMIIHKTLGRNSTMNRTSRKLYENGSKGRWVTKEIDYIGRQTSYEYEPKYGNCVKITSQGNLITNNIYDGWGRLISTTLPDGEILSKSYVWGSNSQIGVPNALYSVVSNSNRIGKITTTYDALGREIQVKDETKPLLSIIETRYNSKGLVEKKTLPYNVEGTSDGSKKWMEFTYDEQNRLLTETSPILLNNTYQYIDQNYSSKIITTNNIDLSVTTQEYNYLGQLEKSTDNGGDIFYTYTSSGQVSQISAPNGNTIIEYDEAGNRRSIEEPNAGKKFSYYNGYGDLTKGVDEKGVVRTYFYSTQGRLYQELSSFNGNNEVVSFSYETENTTSLGEVKTSAKAINNQPSTLTQTSYEYDNLGRVIQIKETVNSKNFIKDFTYNTNGQISTITYPSYNGTNRLTLNYYYNGYGQLNQIKKGNQVLWNKLMDNIYGLPREVHLGNNTGTMFIYNENNQLKNLTSGALQDMGEVPIIRPLSLDPIPDPVSVGSNIQNWAYEYNAQGLMSKRKDNLLGQEERFVYDNLFRLTQIIKEHGRIDRYNTMTYDERGNILSKSDVGHYSYDSDKPNAISGLNNEYNTGGFPTFAPPFFNTINPETLNTEYDVNNKIEKISQGNKELKFLYSSTGNRIKTEYKVNNALQKTVYYIGNYECEVYPNGRIREINYINTSTGHTIVQLKDNKNNIPTDSLYYIFKDHLGSYDRITNQLGQTVETYSFDAWGNRRQASDWTIKDVSETRLFTRGFTGHEHLDAFETINMNGRLYDPTIARFLSPDPYVASNTFTQDYNRYSYCRNNPLLYTDPSGEWALWDDLIVGGVGFATGYISYGITHDDWGWNAVKSGGIGAGTALLSYYTAGGFGLLSGGSTMGALSFTVNYTLSSISNSIFSPEAFTIPISDGFSISLSAGLGFSLSGIGLGFNLSANYSSQDFSASIGFGAGVGSSGEYSGWGANAKYKNWGAGYYRTTYNGNNNQTVGGISLFLGKDVSFRIENDFFGDRNDRWRSSAFELSIGNFSIGSNIYNNEVDRSNSPDMEGGMYMNNSCNRKPFGAWKDGQTYSSPLWIGYKSNGSIYRFGYSHPLVQDLTQNVVHKYGPGRTNFFNKYDYFNKGTYSYYGYNNPYSLW